MVVRDVMTERLNLCTPDTNLQDVARMMADHDCAAIPVVDPETGRAIGIVTGRDVARRALARGRNPLDMRAEDVMTAPVTAVSPGSSLLECEAKMQEAQVRCMPVVDEAGQLCGIISQSDITRAAREMVREMPRLH